MRLPKSFTVIELMVVVAIIAFLATIALPRYFNYYAKAKQAEVSINLASLHTAEEIYKAEHGTYTENLKELGWKPQGNFQYTYGFNVSGSQEEINYFIGKLKAKKESLGRCHANKENFIAKAAGDISGKNKIDVWEINETREIKNLINGLN